MTKTLLFLLFYLSLLMPAAAQTRMFVPNGCGVNKNEMGKNYYVFDPSNEAAQLIKIIMDANFLKSNFEIKASDVENAIATVDHGKRFIIYNTLFIEQIQNNSGSEGAALYVFAHEIAHHLNNHFFDLNDPVKQKEQELEADLFAGAMMYRLGYSMQEAKSGVDIVCNERESETHPPRSARVAAVTSGWKKAREQSNDVQPKRVSLRSVGHTTPPVTVDANVPDNMVLIEGGTFRMGTNYGGEDQKPAHYVTLSSFYLSKMEVTVAEYMDFVEETKSHYPEWLETGSKYNINTGTEGQYKNLGSGLQAPDHPITGVSWTDATAYCDWLSKKTGKKYRLPTESEWEFAARGGEQDEVYSYAGSSSAEEVAWYADDSASTTHPVGQKSHNQLGLFDMSGNVWEWCNDWYGNYYDSKLKDPKGPTTGSGRVIRGGSWDGGPGYCQVVSRNYVSPFNRSSYLGFRLAMTP